MTTQLSPTSTTSTNDLTQVLGEERISIWPEPLKRYLDKQVDVVSLVALDMVGDASTHYGAWEYLSKSSATTRDLILNLKKQRVEQLGIPGMLVTNSPDLPAAFQTLIAELTDGEVEQTVTAVVNAEGPFQFGFLGRPLAEFLNSSV